MKKRISLLLVIIWMVLIFILSHQVGSTSGSLSESILKNIINFITKNSLSNVRLDELIDTYNLIIRKLAHITEYLILGILVTNYIKYYKISLKKVIIISLIICILYSISDEIHQLFIIGRSGQPIDVLIDTIGSYLGITLYNFKKKRI